ncbi:MAG: hypothetical protein K2X09_03495 [Rickettsiales bacterium]|nr:hypothetical protein [Rickettsiales bacterium]
MGPVGLTLDRATPALAAFARTSDALQVSAIRLSSGERYQTVGDDVANVTSASRLQAQTSSLRSALVNGARATSLLQVAYDGLAQIRSILDSLNDLTTTANRTGLTSRDYATLDGQFQSLQLQIDAIATTTKYNGAALLDGTSNGSGAPVFQLGFPANSTVTVAIPNVTSASLFPTPVTLGDAAGASAATTTVTSASDAVNTAIAKIDGYQSQLDTADAATRRSIFGITNATNALIATDTSAETTSRARNLFQQQATATLIAQTLGLSSNLLRLVEA